MNQCEKKKSTISIVTASYNAVSHLPQLIKSLRGQTDKDFEWVVADGHSTDGSLELLQSITDINIIISSQPDFGIYDAINRAISIMSGEYYIVAGADDYFYSDAIAKFRSAIDKSHADVIAAKVMFGQHCFKVKRGPSWLFGAHAFIAIHSLSATFRKDLHRTFGFYSKKFPICADSLFVIQACKGGATRYEADFVAGELGCSGVSFVDWAGNATEFFRVQLITGCSLTMQVLLLLLRLLKGRCSSARSLHDSVLR